MSDAVSARELEHGRLVRRAAAEGIVLLRNENGLLPLAPGTPLGLYGAGAVQTIKGGTGSGDVNERHSVGIAEGLAQAGFPITSRAWLNQCAQHIGRARREWAEKIKERMADGQTPFFKAYFETPFRFPSGPAFFPEPGEEQADTAIFVISRVAGEGADRTPEKGDYRLSDEERTLLGQVAAFYPHLILVINAGGVVDLSFIDEYPQIETILFLVQPGQEGGRALADVVSGAVTPSGRLTDTWPLRLEDRPASVREWQGSLCLDRYTEGIYVGYRYYDTFGIPVRYSFGYGLSYTTFRQTLRALQAECGADGQTVIRIAVEVRNTGRQHSGREVVQLYASCPAGRLPKEFRRLIGFAKTEPLAPGQSTVEEILVPLERLASYCPEDSAWLMEAGDYGIWTGGSLEAAELSAVIRMNGAHLVLPTTAPHLCQETPNEIQPDEAALAMRRQAAVQSAMQEGVPVLELHAKALRSTAAPSSRTSAETGTRAEAVQLAGRMTVEQLISVTVGAQEGEASGQLGASGRKIPGSAAETTARFMGPPWYLDSLVLADGPAGLRLRREYAVADGKIVPDEFPGELERGFFAEETEPVGTIYHQYCTAIPVGTLLAQSWDVELMRAMGRLVGREMKLFGVSIWLAPGINIHRDLLGGRNFEYYSEDPLLTGELAAGMIEGVQSVPGCGAAVKHFACNNTERDRLAADARVSDRALREIYLKPFEIAVRKAKPWAIMTAYNLVNGIYAANHRALCTETARKEWGFSGVFMTDWAATVSSASGMCSAAGCIRAGNDMIMPGSDADISSIAGAVECGDLSVEALRACAERVISAVLDLSAHNFAL